MSSMCWVEDFPCGVRGLLVVSFLPASLKTLGDCQCSLGLRCRMSDLGEVLVRLAVPSRPVNPLVA